MNNFNFINLLVHFFFPQSHQKDWNYQHDDSIHLREKKDLGKTKFFAIFLITLLINIPLRAEECVMDGHQYVDLALPSGTLWATCNIGAATPLDNGFYFAWAEVKSKPKTDYTPAKYKYNKGGMLPTPTRPTVVSPQRFSWNLTKYSYKLDNKIFLENSDDAAIINWGEKWRTPTIEQLRELREECKWSSGYVNNVYCWIFTGRNGNFIILPLPGNYSVIPGNKVSENISKSKEGIYWSRNLGDKYDHNAFCMVIQDDGRCSEEKFLRVCGCSIRPVVYKEATDSIINMKTASLMQGLKTDRSISKNNSLMNFPFSVCTYYLRYSQNDDNKEKLFNEIYNKYPDLRYSKSLEDAAVSGDTDALFMLGYCYFRGLGVSINKDESRKYFIIASEKGDAKSTVMLFSLGLVEEYRMKLYRGFLTNACLKEYQPALLLNAILESNLEYQSPNRETLEMNIKACVENNYPEAEYIYGEYCKDLKSMELAAEHGFVYAANRAATILAQQGEYAKALYYARLSQKDHNYEIAGATLLLIQLHCDDPKEIANGMHKAYLEGAYDIVESTYVRAKTKKLQTIDMEVIMAMCIRAKGDMANCSMANKTLKEYAEQGNILAQEELALSYEKGMGMSSPDMSAAISWYRKAAQNGSKKAQEYLNNRNLSW